MKGIYVSYHNLCIMNSELCGSIQAMYICSIAISGGYYYLEPSDLWQIMSNSVLSMFCTDSFSNMDILAVLL